MFFFGSLCFVVFVFLFVFAISAMVCKQCDEVEYFCTNIFLAVFVFVFFICFGCTRHSLATINALCGMCDHHAEFCVLGGVFLLLLVLLKYTGCVLQMSIMGPPRGIYFCIGFCVFLFVFVVSMLLFCVLCSSLGCVLPVNRA